MNASPILPPTKPLPSKPRTASDPEKYSLSSSRALFSHGLIADEISLNRLGHMLDRKDPSNTARSESLGFSRSRSLSDAISDRFNISYPLPDSRVDQVRTFHRLIHKSNILLVYPSSVISRYEGRAVSIGTQ